MFLFCQKKKKKKIVATHYIVTCIQSCINYTIVHMKKKVWIVPILKQNVNNAILIRLQHKLRWRESTSYLGKSHFAPAHLNVVNQ